MENSLEYNLARRDKELEMGRAALDPALAKIHRDLAEHYDRLIKVERQVRGPSRAI